MAGRIFLMGWWSGGVGNLHCYPFKINSAPRERINLQSAQGNFAENVDNSRVGEPSQEFERNGADYTNQCAVDDA